MFFSYGLLWFAILELYYSAGSTGNPWILLQYTIRLAGFEIYYSDHGSWICRAYLDLYLDQLEIPSMFVIPERLSLHGHQNDILSKLW